MSALAVAKTAARSLGIDTRVAYQAVSARSIEAAVREQGLASLRARLRELVPDLTDQYTRSFDSDEYSRLWEPKMRSLHAFQIRSALEALDRIPGENLTIVDVGDSSGNHGVYLEALSPKGKVGRTISVNQDPVAVEKIRSKGGDAVLCRAEDLESAGLKPDLMLLFETLEHLTDPLRFLHATVTAGGTENLLLTVPYRRDSRFGGDLIRAPFDAIPREITAEEVHIFELCPEDWKLMARLAGYRTEFCRLYRQYPRRSFFRMTAPVWRRLDFEGFIALFLRRDTTLSEKYTGW